MAVTLYLNVFVPVESHLPLRHREQGAAIQSHPAKPMTLALDCHGAFRASQ